MLYDSLLRHNWSISSTTVRGESYQTSKRICNFFIKLKKLYPHQELGAGGKPSTWFPPGRLVEHSICIRYQLPNFHRFFGPRLFSVFGNPLRSLLPSPWDLQISKTCFQWKRPRTEFLTAFLAWAKLRLGITEALARQRWGQTSIWWAFVVSQKFMFLDPLFGKSAACFSTLQSDRFGSGSWQRVPYASQVG